MPAPNLDDLIAKFGVDALRPLLLEAYRRGENAAESRLRATVLQALGAPVPFVSPDGPQVRAPAAPDAQPVILGDEDDADDSTPRAPRGLTREVVTMLLEDRPGLPTLELQEGAVMFDSRLSAKTVYNELNREKGVRYRLALGRWYLIDQPDRATTDPAALYAELSRAAE